MNGITAIANILKLEGVEYMSCFPQNVLIDPAAEVGIRPIVTRSERVAVNIADGYTRVTNGRRAIVCGVQSQAGIENSFAGVAQAFADSVPILVLPQGDARRRLGVLPSFDATPNYRGVTKWAARINFADRVPELFRRAFTQLRMGRPGPVLLEIPVDLAEEEVDDAAFSYDPVERVRAAADPDLVKEAAEAILGAETPLIHAGQGVLYARAWDELQEFAELIQTPVMTTMTGKSAFPEDHPLALGIGAKSGTKAVGHFLRKADLVFGIGCSFTKWWMGALIPPGKVMIHSSVDERDINKDYPVDIALIGDAKLVLRQLIDEVKLQIGPGSQREGQPVVGEIQRIKDQWMEEWMPKLTSDEVPISPYRVIWELMRNLDPGKAIVTHESGGARDQMAPLYVATTPRGYLGWGHSTQLGTSLGLAMGAKLAAPEKTVVNVMGDGAFGMVGTDFETAARQKIPILTIVLNNSMLGGYGKFIPIATELYGARFLSGQYAKVGSALGGYGQKLESPDEIAPAIERAKKALDSGQPALLEVITREELVVPEY